MPEIDLFLVRPERPEDVAAIAHVNDLAFGQPDESQIIQAVREAGHPAISLVATTQGLVVGHILFTPVNLESSGRQVTVSGLGPMAVLPTWQRKGIGSRLVTSGLRECSSRGCQAVVVIGHPQFYPRFGFRPAKELGLRCEFEVPDEAFMAAELIPGALGGRGGFVRYVREFGTG